MPMNPPIPPDARGAPVPRCALVPDGLALCPVVDGRGRHDEVHLVHTRSGWVLPMPAWPAHALPRPRAELVAEHLTASGIDFTAARSDLLADPALAGALRDGAFSARAEAHGSDDPYGVALVMELVRAVRNGATAAIRHEGVG